MTGRILIGDHVSAHRIILKSRLVDAAYRVELARSAEETLRMVDSFRPNAIIISNNFADVDGLDVLRMLRNITLQVPIIFLSDDMARPRRLAAIQAGADAVLPCLPDTVLLRARLRNLMRRSAEASELEQSGAESTAIGFAEAPSGFTRPGQVTLIASTLAEGLEWRNGLNALMRDHISVIDPRTALQDMADLGPPDAVIVGQLDTQTETAMQLVSDLRARPQTLHSAILLTQPESNLQRSIAAFDLGVCEVVEDGFDANEMAVLLRREMVRKARDDKRRADLKDGIRLAHTDPLTGLHNRRSALRHLGLTIREAQDEKANFAVMVLDLDRFKSVNDTFGHAAGDAVLSEVANRMNKCLRSGDFMARIGGEEFLAVIKNCDVESAKIAAERLRMSVANVPVVLGDPGTKVEITVSIGMVIVGTGAYQGTPPELIDLADRGLYAAKAEGRNQVTIYQSAA